MLRGGCYCGAIRYEVTGVVTSQSLCHCVQCRRTTGAPCVAWFTAPRERFQLVAGTPASFRSSDHASRGFCAACGTQLTFADDNFPGEIDLTTCSLDNPALVPPGRHIYTHSQLPWLKVADGLPTFKHSSVEG
ncbi:GFA family protein [Massilia sp. CF038]|uniref:GFA family protein n=1 Tax=Massilia sp. CF038 TaxID=1881045 RepID=UPI000915E688|nr:GFA family protein [Massilia sp. CF038]SHH68019.1 Uncharacterized conserved protein [Massilia sp. CF038]